MNELADLCRCGHDRGMHETLKRPQCAMLFHKRKGLLAERCSCDEFQFDNLRYLEAVAFRNGY